MLAVLLLLCHRQSRFYYINVSAEHQCNNSAYRSRMLKQTAASPDRSIHLNLGGDEANDYFNFGHFDDVLTHNVSPLRYERKNRLLRGSRTDGCVHKGFKIN